VPFDPCQGRFAFSAFIRLKKNITLLGHTPHFFKMDGEIVDFRAPRRGVDTSGGRRSDQNPEKDPANVFSFAGSETVEKLIKGGRREGRYGERNPGRVSFTFN